MKYLVIEIDGSTSTLDTICVQQALEGIRGLMVSNMLVREVTPNYDNTNQTVLYLGDGNAE